jgi:UDP:flavonoid glycosyltransferase YjiC (YdhE family)
MPATGHISPFIPLAAKLVHSGHRVVWHTGPAYASTVRATGACFASFAETPDFEQIRIEPDPGTKGMAAGVSVMRRLFIDRVAGQVADYEQILAGFPAAVLFTDMCCLGAATLRDRGGPPFATLGINPLITLDPEIPPFGTGRPPATSALGRLRNRASHWMARRFFLSQLDVLLNGERAKLGLPPLPRDTNFANLQRSPYLHLMPTTEAFEYPRCNLEPQIHFVGPLLPAPPTSFSSPDWWADLDGRRVVHVTQGTYATQTANLIRPAVEGLAELDLLVVVTTPEPAALGSLPRNVRVARFIPHAALLPRVDVMVTNAGYNGVLAALAHGVPLVCAGRSEDKADVSARVAWSGAGLDLKTDTPSADQVCQAVLRVLDGAAYQAAARRIQADFARHDPPAEAARLLEQLADTGSPVLRRAITACPADRG